GLLELHRRSRVAARGALDDVRNVGALLDVRLLVVGGDHAWARHDLAAIVRFESGKLEVDQIAATEIDQRQRKLSGGICDRQVDVQLIRRRITGRRETGGQLEWRLCIRRPSAAGGRTWQVDNRLSRQAAADAHGIAAITECRAGLLSEPNTERSAESVVGNYDP